MSPNHHTLTASTHQTPAGPLSLLAADGTVVGSGFGRPQHVARELGLPGLLRAGAGPADEAVRAWLAGDRRALGEVAAAQEGTDLQQRVWAALAAVPWGEVVSYGQLAVRAGKPRAVRAVASACAANRLAPLVPCHRAVPAAGGEGDYRWGTGVKSWLLALERRR